MPVAVPQAVAPVVFARLIGRELQPSSSEDALGDLNPGSSSSTVHQLAGFRWVDSCREDSRLGYAGIPSCRCSAGGGSRPPAFAGSRTALLAGDT